MFCQDVGAIINRSLKNFLLSVPFLEIKKVIYAREMKKIFRGFVK